MKEHAKKALKHDISVAGKTVPTLAIVALFLVGGGSAALLSSFGTVEGTADVDQSIVFGQESGDELSSFDTQTAAGSTTVDTAWLNNTLERPVEVAFNSTQEFEQTDEVKKEGTVEGLQTGFVAFDGLQRTYALDSIDEAGATGEFVADSDDDSNLPAYHAEIEGDFNEIGDYALSGLTFDVENTEFDESNTLRVNYSKGDSHDSDRKTPDWVTYTLQVDEGFEAEAYNLSSQSYKTVDLTSGDTVRVLDSQVQVDSGTQFSWGSDGPFGDRVVVSVQRDGNQLFLSGEQAEGPQTDASDLVSNNLTENSQVTEVSVATGTNGVLGTGNPSDIYYHDVSFNGEPLMKAIPHTDEDSIPYTVPSGDHQVKVVNELAVNVKPGDYTVEAEARPLSSQQPE